MHIPPIRMKSAYRFLNECIVMSLVKFRYVCLIPSYISLLGLVEWAKVKVASSTPRNQDVMACQRGKLFRWNL